MEQALTSDFPSEFGGLRFHTDGAFTVLEVGGPHPDLEEAAAVSSAGLPAAFGEPDVAPIALSFADVTYPFAQVDAVRRSISSIFSTLPGIVSVGLDEPDNRVIVTQNGSEAGVTMAAQLESEYPPGILSVETGSIPVATVGRYSDSPPRNAGDMLYTTGGATACSSGYGVQNNQARLFTVTAGHCGYQTWYNTDDRNNQGIFNSSTLVGTTLPGSVIYGGLDTSLIPTDSSCIAWAGQSTNSGNLVKRYIVNPADAPASTLVTMSGAFGRAISGTILQTNTKFTEFTPSMGYATIEGGWIASGLIVDGDSGGPLIWNSPYGPAASGIIDAANPPGNETYGQDQAAIDYAYTVLPNTTPNGTSC